MFAESGRLRRPDSACLAWHHAPARGIAHGILLICHGLAEHSRRYATFAVRMSASGLHVYAHDQRGHGETIGPDATSGRFATRGGAQAVVDDVLAMRDMALSRYPRLPVLLFGHAMGGLVAMNAAQSEPGAFAGAAVWSTNFRPGMDAKAARAILKLEKMLKGSDVPSDMLPRLTFQTWGQAVPGAQTPFDWLSRNADAVAAYIGDPLCGFDASVSLWLDILTLMDRGLEQIASTRLRRDFPFHLAAGGDDPATRQGSDTVWLANHLKKQGYSNISCHIHSGMRHEIWNETGSGNALSEFADWCGHVCEPRGGRAES